MTRCWIVHRFGKWKSYKATYHRPVVDYTDNTATLTTHTFIEERQERECERCGYKQDRKIGAK